MTKIIFGATILWYISDPKILFEFWDHKTSADMTEKTNIVK